MPKKSGKSVWGNRGGRANNTEEKHYFGKYYLWSNYALFIIQLRHRQFILDILFVTCIFSIYYKMTYK